MKTDTQGNDHRDGDWSDEPRTDSHHQKLKEARKDSLLHVSEGSGPASTLILDL